MDRQSGDSEFRRWRRQRLKRFMVVCIAAIPIGLLFLGSSPQTTAIVSGLGLLGCIAIPIKLRRMEGR